MPKNSRSLPIVSVLLALFTLFTLAEIWLIFQMAELITWPFTILIAIGTGVVGSVMIKKQGISVMHKGIQQARGGKFPAQPIAEGVMIIIGGAFLMTPGVITDVIGLSTLIPPVRSFYARLMIGFVMRNFTLKARKIGANDQAGFFYTNQPNPFTPPNNPGAPPFGSPADQETKKTDEKANPFNTPQSGSGKRSFTDEDVIDVEFTRRD
ncbi:MAG: FxsA family protein [Sumerlaeia bacterium]